MKLEVSVNGSRVDPEGLKSYTITNEVVLKIINSIFERHKGA